MIIDIISKIDKIIKKNNYSNHLDVIKTNSSFNIYILKLYIQYIIYTNGNYIDALYELYDNLNISEYFYLFFYEIKNIINININLLTELDKDYAYIIKIINFLIDNSEPILITINHSCNMNHFLLLYSNKKKWIEKINYLYKNNNTIEALKLINEGYIICEIINVDNFYKNINENVIFINTYLVAETW
jgi:hypothetical protein